MEILISKKAEKEIGKINKDAQKRILLKLMALVEEGPFSLPYKKISGTENRYRIRSGDYRVVYEVCGDEVLVLKVGKRSNVYK